MLCEKHYRFGQMRSTARKAGKVVPSHDDLEAMASKSMKCPGCGVVMNWRRRDGNSTVASLQHYRDSTMAIVCISCNSRHASMAGDSYRDMPKDHKCCPKCQGIKPWSDFSADNGRTGLIKLNSICKQCSNENVNKWRRENRMKYNAYQRELRAKKRLADAMIAEGSK